MLILLVFVILLPMSITLARPSVATSAVSAQVFPSVGTVSPGDRFGVEVIVSNSGKAVAQNVSVKLAVPSGWTPPSSGGAQTNLSPNQTRIWHFSVGVPSNATGSQYTILALVNSTIGATAASATIQVAATSVALPTGQIPVSLILILIPGVLSASIFAWIFGVKLGADWRVALLAFLLGSLEWFVAPWPVRPFFSERNVLGLTLQFGVSDVESIALLVVGLGFLPALVLSGFRKLVPKIESQFEDKLRSFRGPQTKQPDALDYALSRAVKKSYTRSPRATALLNVVAGSNPQVTVCGLLKSFDDKPPYDLLLVPRYGFVLQKEDFGKAIRRLPWLLQRRLSKRLGKEVINIEPEDWDWEKIPLRDRIEVSAKIGDRLRKLARKTPVQVPPRPIDGPEVEILIKGGDVHRIEVLDYVSPHIIVVKDRERVVTALPLKEDKDLIPPDKPASPK